MSDSNANVSNGNVESRPTVRPIAQPKNWPPASDDWHTRDSWDDAWDRRVALEEANAEKQDLADAMVIASKIGRVLEQCDGGEAHIEARVDDDHIIISGRRRSIVVLF